MRQDYFVFLEVFQETLQYFFGIDFNGWWATLAEKGTDKIYLAGILLVLTAIALGGFFHWSFRFVAYCLLGSFLGVILVAGETPSMPLATLAVLYVTVTMAFGNGKKRKIAAITGLAVLGLSAFLLFVSNQVGVPLLKSAFGDVMPLRTKIQNTSLVHVLNDLLPDELKFQDGTGEYEGGSLETQEEGPQFTGRTIVSVESDTMPERPIYWARYTGNVYTGYSFDDAGDLDDPNNSANRYYPKDVLSNLAEFCEANPVEGGAAEIRDFIVATLSERTTYDLQVDPLPEGKDFIEYFFFEQQEGYCIHYAAAATMMFRMYGIPARYVTGFLVSPSMFYLNEDGVYQADVPDDQAHAWVEIYVDGSWITVEATPSGGVPLEPETEENTEGMSEEGMTEEAVSENGTTEGENGGEAELSTELIGTSMTEFTGISETEMLESESEPASESESESEQVTDAAEPEALDALTENLGPSWIFLPVILLLALILIGAGFFVRRFLILERRRKETVQAMFADLYEVMLQGGLSPEITILSDDFTEKVLEKFPWIDPEEWDAVLEIVMRTTYGPRRATDEEWIIVQRMYYQVCRQMGRSLRGMAKIAFYLVDVWI